MAVTENRLIFGHLIPTVYPKHENPEKFETSTEFKTFLEILIGFIEKKESKFSSDLKNPKLNREKKEEIEKKLETINQEWQKRLEAAPLFYSHVQGIGLRKMARLLKRLRIHHFDKIEKDLDILTERIDVLRPGEYYSNDEKMIWLRNTYYTSFTILTLEKNYKTQTEGIVDIMTFEPEYILNKGRKIRSCIGYNTARYTYQKHNPN
jgi:hypothetical protein